MSQPFFGNSNSFWSEPKSRAFMIETNEEDTVEIITPDSLGLANKFESSVVMYMGRRGKGKTLGMTCMADFFKTMYDRPGCHRKKIASNYWMACADYIRPDMLQWLNTFAPNVRDLYVCLDEIGSQVSNRKSLRGANVDFAQLLVQIRKRMIEMSFATQFPQTVDWQTLLQVDLFLEMDGYDMDYRGVPRQIHVKVADWWGQWTGKNWSKHWPPREGDWDDEFTIHDSHKLADAYMSDMVIPPDWSKNKDQVIHDEWGDLLEDTDYESGQEATPTGQAFMNMSPEDQAAKLLAEVAPVFAPKLLASKLKRLDKSLNNQADVREALSEGKFGIKCRIFKDSEGSWMAEKI